MALQTLVAFLAIASILYWKHHQLLGFLVGSRKATIFQDYDNIKRLLDPPNTPIQVLLHRRAVPNHKLIGAFQLHTSTFTSSCPKVHTNFQKSVQARLKVLDSPPKWYSLREVINDVVDFYLPTDSPPRDYASHVQAVVFTVVLAAFFDFRGPFPEISDLLYVTQSINELWIAAKKNKFSPPTLSKINSHLREWIPHNPGDPFDENPLELIIPAYETLWRLVAHSFHYAERSAELRLPFTEFYKTPTVEQFTSYGDDGKGPSAKDIMQEVLRLHPPTKRLKRLGDDPSLVGQIGRLFRIVSSRESTGDTTIFAADIEAIQRIPSVWGSSANEFDASRHRHLSPLQKANMMAFGCGPLKCVAFSIAPRLAGITVASMLWRQDTKVVRGEITGDREGWKGWEISRRR